MDEATARPWAAFQTGSEGCSIVARDIRAPRVARLTSADLPTCKADAALIVEAVNAYDRLRAIEAAARAVDAAMRTVTATAANFAEAPTNAESRTFWMMARDEANEAHAALRAALEVPSDAR